MRSLCLVVLIGCSSPSTDVVGPFTGEVQRFAIDRITVPRDTTVATMFAGDLNGDGAVENQLGLVTAVLASTNDFSLDAADMIASGALASSIELQADDLSDDDSVGVTYFGADGDPATVMGGKLVGGAFRSNRAFETRVPGRARVRLPIYTNADPLAIDLDGLELDLAPDGAGGYDAVVRGGIRLEHARAVAYAGLRQMFATEPDRHLVFLRQVDKDNDDAMSAAELDESVISLLVVADVHMFDGDRYAPSPDGPEDTLSVAFGAHFVPCPSGSCALATPAMHCRDRVRDGDETDVDCGGSCQPCATALACSVPADCRSRACDANRCRAPSCTDGVRDGFESDTDCGGACGACETGEACAADRDCTSAQCDQGPTSVGACL